MEKYNQILEEALVLIELGCEPNSALKQAASDNGIKFGEEMKKFVDWANEQF